MIVDMAAWKRQQSSELSSDVISHTCSAQDESVSVFQTHVNVRDANSTCSDNEHSRLTFTCIWMYLEDVQS